MSERLAIHGGTPARTKPFPAAYDYGDDDVAAVTAVLRRGNETGSISRGPEQAMFEREFADRHDARFAIFVNSGTSAFHTIFGAINPDPGDEVICTPWTSGGSVAGALFQGCVPVFADIDDGYNIDPADVEAKITPRTKAIVAVHMFGNPCDMDAYVDMCTRHGLYLIEDCSQAHLSEYQGRIVGTMGDIAGYSFSGKHISGGGGGAVLTNNRSLWDRAHPFADQALNRPAGPFEARPYAHQFLAQNFKMNDLTAAVMRVQLRKIDGYLENKIRNAKNIIEGLSDVEEITPQRVRPGDRHTYWVLGFTLDTDRLGCDAYEFSAAVSAEGVPMSEPYMGTGRDGPLYRNPVYAEARMFRRKPVPPRLRPRQTGGLPARRVPLRGGADGPRGGHRHEGVLHRGGRSGDIIQASPQSGRPLPALARTRPVLGGCYQTSPLAYTLFAGPISFALGLETRSATAASYSRLRST